MTMTPKQQLRELDYTIARKLMGLDVIDIPFVPAEVKREPNTHLTDIAQDIWRKIYTKAVYVPVVPHYTSDRNAAANVLEKIAELNKQDDFCRALNKIVKPEEESGLSYAYTWALRMATPRQMMEAALKCLGEKA